VVDWKLGVVVIVQQKKWSLPRYPFATLTSRIIIFTGHKPPSPQMFDYMDKEGKERNTLVFD